MNVQIYLLAVIATMYDYSTAISKLNSIMPHTIRARTSITSAHTITIVPGARNGYFNNNRFDFDFVNCFESFSV